MVTVARLTQELVSAVVPPWASSGAISFRSEKYPAQHMLLCTETKHVCALTL